MNTSINIRWCSIQPKQGKKLLIGSYYRPPSDSADELNPLNDSLGKVFAPRNVPNVILGGDFNASGISWTDDQSTCNDTCPEAIKKKLSGIAARFGLSQLQNEVTRPESGSCLDLVFTNNQTCVRNINTVDGMGDHLALSYQVPCAVPCSPAARPSLYRYHKANMAAIKRDMTSFHDDLSHDWSDHTPEENWTRFHNTLTQSMHRNIPQTQTGKRNNLPWVTSSVKKHMHRRNRLLKKAKLKNTPKAWETYRAQRNATTKVIRRAHEKYVHDIIGDLDETTATDSFAGIKRFWRYVKATKKECTGVPTLHTDCGIAATDRDKENLLNKQFEDAFTSERLVDVPNLGQSPFPSCPDITFTAPGIIKLLQRLKPHKASGPDSLPPRLLRELAQEIGPTRTILFQQIFDTGCTPQDWRDAIVAPIYKKGNSHNPENYRPVSLTSVICKIQEHIICSNIMDHLERCSILSDDQHGFRSGLSTETQLLAATHDWAEVIDRGGQTDVLFLDFSKAFDSVPHNRLLEKLRYYGIDGKHNTLISSLLHCRRQRVVINGTSSSWVPVTSGVPQGTVMGPILFLIYINDIQQGITSHMRLFADDSIIYKEIRSNADHMTLCDDLTRLDQWAEKWQMIFKPEKCFVMNISNKHNISHHGYQLKGKQLSTVTTWTYLGVEIDSKLTWTPQCEKVKRSAMRTLGVIQRTLHAAPKSCRATAYQTLVKPKLEYASTAWSPQTSGKTRLLESVQNKAARFVCRDYSRTTSVSQLKTSLKWDPLEARRKAKDCVMRYKVHNHLVHLTFPTTVTPKPRLGRHDHQLAYRHLSPRIDAYKHSFFVRTIPMWNGLPATTVATPTLQAFQRLALAHFRSQGQVHLP